jgi:hypothetical protein
VGVNYEGGSMTIYSFFRKWVNDKMYFLKLKKHCHPQSKEPLWIPQWTKPVKRDNPDRVYDPDWQYDIMYSDLIGNLNYEEKSH